MEKRKYIPVFLDWPEVTCALSWEEKGRLVEAMVLYARGDDYEAYLVGNERFLFPALRGAIDRMAALSRKRAEAGRRGGMKSAGQGKANDDNMEKGSAFDDSDISVNGCFQSETDLCKAKQREGNCAEGGYNNDNNNEYNNKYKYNNENGNEEPKGERIRAHARRSPVRQALFMNHRGQTEHFQHLQHLQQVQHMQPTSTSTSTSSSTSTSASASSSASTGIARTRGNAPPQGSC